MNKKFAFVAISLAIGLIGCQAALQSGSGNSPSATTAPSASHTTSLDSIVTAAGSVATNPAVVLASVPFPWLTPVLAVIGALTGMYSTYRHLTVSTPTPPSSTTAPPAPPPK